jgi:hypothetical protein
MKAFIKIVLRSGSVIKYGNYSYTNESGDELEDQTGIDEAVGDYLLITNDIQTGGELDLLQFPNGQTILKQKNSDASQASNSRIFYSITKGSVDSVSIVELDADQTYPTLGQF